MAINARGIPTAECPDCGSDKFQALVQFDKNTYEIAWYALNAKCISCDTLVTLPTPLDLEI